MAGIIYSSLPTSVKLRIGINPNITSASWCGYDPNNYSIPVFLKGIYRDVYMGSVTSLKESITEPWLAEWIEEDPEAFLGDAFRHIELGQSFIEEYIDIDEADKPLGPVSGHHINIITETDRTIEKWQVRRSHNRDTYATFFKDYSGFKLFVDLLKGNMEKAVKKALGLIVKAVMTSDPTKTSFDDKDIARIFGRGAGVVGTANSDGSVPDSKAATTYNKLMQKLISKYYGKALALWRNIQWYNPYFFSHSMTFEEMRKKDIYEVIPEGKDAAKRQMQQLYSVGHKDTNGEEDADGKTKFIDNLTRNDCLFALFDTINKALLVLTNEESSQYWLGKESLLDAFGTPQEAMRQQQLQGLEGSALSHGDRRPDDSHNTSASSSDDFEVTANTDNLVLLLNPEDYAELKVGIARRGQMDVRAVNLDMLGLKRIYPMRGMKAGFARLIDKRAFKIRSYFQMTDIQTPMEQLTWRYKLFYQLAITIFKNFAGCLFVPTPHFVASAQFYNKYKVIGEPVEKKK